MMRGMDLRTYLRDNSATDLARTIGVSPVQITQWRSKWEGRSPNPANAVAIEQATRGAVMRWDLRPNDWHLIWPELTTRPDAPAIRAEREAA